MNININNKELEEVMTFIMKDLTIEEQVLVQKIINKVIDKYIKEVESLKIPEPIEPIRTEFEFDDSTKFEGF